MTFVSCLHIMDFNSEIQLDGKIYMGRKLCFVGQKTNGTHFRLE